MAAGFSADVSGEWKNSGAGHATAASLVSPFAGVGVTGSVRGAGATMSAFGFGACYAHTLHVHPLMFVGPRSCCCDASDCEAAAVASVGGCQEFARRLYCFLRLRLCSPIASRVAVAGRAIAR